ncbi:class I SAM-dependent methyltransferase [Stappia stellulata]|uniref:class I SAM-dependent methyltransferase n=1 Tax=Stappia stellulata TaxID=71235 RepID=UPI00040F7924|nr:class I SAM-dependent methyltransferase [Stappia stellulata]
MTEPSTAGPAGGRSEGGHAHDRPRGGPGAEAWKTAFGGTYLDLYASEFSETLDRIQVGDVIDMLGLFTGAKLLDAGCGQGRHLKQFIDAGLDAVGLDFSGEMLAAARGKGLPAGRLVQGDIRSPPFPAGCFDAVASLYTAFGFFDDADEDLAALKAFRRVLRPGGWLVLETIHAGGPARMWPERKSYPLGPSAFVREENRVDWKTGTLDQVVTVESGSARPRVFATRLRIYTKRQLSELLEAAGFVDIACKEGFRTDPQAPASFGPLLATSSRIACIGRCPPHAPA